MDKELIEKITEMIDEEFDEIIASSYGYEHLAERILALIRSAGYVQQWKECPECHGKGGYSAVNNYPDNATDMVYTKCPICNGTGKVRDTYTVEEAGGVRKKWYAEVENNSHYVVIDLHNLQREMRISESWWQQFKERGIEQ